MSKKTKASLTASSDVKGKQRAVETPAKAKKPEKIKLRRVHVSGLPAGLSEEDVKNRFKTFGEVKSVDNLGKIDGNGQSARRRDPTSNLIETLHNQDTRCDTLSSTLNAQRASWRNVGTSSLSAMPLAEILRTGMNLLSGSVWKGSTLRIAEAKPTFTERCAYKCSGSPSCDMLSGDIGLREKGSKRPARSKRVNLAYLK